MHQLQKRVRSGSVDVDRDDPFDLFLAATSIRYCYYSETHKILGSTYGMCVLQVGRTPSHLHTLTHPLYGAPAHSHTVTPPPLHTRTRTLSHCHNVTPSPCHSITPSHSQCHSVTPSSSHCHIVTPSPCHSITPSHSHTVTVSHQYNPHTVTPSHSHTVTVSHQYNPHTVTLSHCHTLTLSRIVHIVPTFKSWLYIY